MVNLGFESAEFSPEKNDFPYAQFSNPVKDDIAGIYIKLEQAEMAEFKPDEAWKLCEKTFMNDGKPVKTPGYYTQTPRCLVLRRSELCLLNKETKELRTYDDNIKKEAPKTWQTVSYFVIWFLDKNNQFLSKIPLRLKCGGQAGVSFSRTWDKEFRPQVLEAYKKVTGVYSEEKNDKFYAFMVYRPLMKEGLATNPEGQSSSCILTEGLIEPITPQNFLSGYVIPYQDENGQITSQAQKIEGQIEETESWVDVLNREKESNPIVSATIQEGIERSNELIAKLGWKTERARQYLMDNYNKGIRKELTEAEMESFVESLEILVNSLPPVANYEDTEY